MCADADAMVRVLTDLAASSAADLGALAKRQFDATMTAYSPDRYHRDAGLIMARVMAEPRLR